MQARKEPLSTIQYMGTVRIAHFATRRTHFVIPAHAGISGWAVGGEIPGRGPG